MSGRLSIDINRPSVLQRTLPLLVSGSAEDKICIFIRISAGAPCGLLDSELLQRTGQRVSREQESVFSSGYQLARPEARSGAFSITH